MRKTYMKPACEVMYMEKTPMMNVSQWDTDKTPDNPNKPGGGMGAGGSGEEVPESSKGGFPWSDDFDFNMD
ncbi:MAG: hypothetical protein K2H16_00105 [Prevotella sp.]|nr:hypothetical protein [Prevotella sp.]